MNDLRSCANCKHLSGAVVADFGERREERVLCMKGEWKRGSVIFETIRSHPGTFRARAERCAKYAREPQGECSHNATELLEIEFRNRKLK